MITKEELRKMVILNILSDGMIMKIMPLVERKRFNDGEKVFRGTDMAEHFYLLNSGKILLEQRLSDKMTVSIDSIKPGYSFGWSSLLSSDLEPYSQYTSDAICVEPSEVFAISGEDLQRMMEEDYHMGFLLTRRLNRVIKQRLVHRTEQFIRLIKKHPDIHNLIT